MNEKNYEHAPKKRCLGGTPEAGIASAPKNMGAENGLRRSKRECGGPRPVIPTHMKTLFWSEVKDAGKLGSDAALLVDLTGKLWVDT